MPNNHHILALIFNDFEALDLFGPLGSIVPRSDFYTLSLVNVHNLPAPHGLESTIKNGIGIVPNISLADALKTYVTAGYQNKHFDTLFIPGGPGMLPLTWDPVLLKQIGLLADLALNVFTVCTGGVVLAATGRLDGRKATTNKRSYEEHTRKYPNVEWQKRARWVQDGKFLSSSGVTAGMDAGFFFLSRTYIPPQNRNAHLSDGEIIKARRDGDAIQLPGFDAQKALDYAHSIAYELEYRWHDDPSDDPFVRLTRKEIEHMKIG